MRVIAALSLVLAAGCAHNSLVDLHAGKVEGPPAFQDGYRAGCQSGLRAGGVVQLQFSKDVVRYNADKLYAQGWEDGYAVCRSQYIK